MIKMTIWSKSFDSRAVIDLEIKSNNIIISAYFKTDYKLSLSLMYIMLLYKFAS